MSNELNAVYEDAERWRALMASGRMHFMGCAGFELKPKVPGDASRKTQDLTAVPGAGALHFGMEFWDTHPATGDSRYPDQFERDLMIAYVDAIRERRRK